jgi:Spy/CpxP family protein refolding chaperone
MKRKLIMAIVIGTMMVAPFYGWSQSQQRELKRPEHFQVAMLEKMPGMTTELKTKMDALKVTHMKQIQALKNKMHELKAHQRTLETADKPDMKAVYANIDEMTKLQNQMMKAQADHRNEIRSMLNDEQKLWFDNHSRGGERKGGPNGERPSRGDRGHMGKLPVNQANE